MNNLSWIRALNSVGKLLTSMRLDGEDSLKRFEADKLLGIVAQQMAKELEDSKKVNDKIENAEGFTGGDVNLGGGVVAHNAVEVG